MLTLPSVAIEIDVWVVKPLPALAKVTSKRRTPPPEEPADGTPAKPEAPPPDPFPAKGMRMRTRWLGGKQGEKVHKGDITKKNADGTFSLVPTKALVATSTVAAKAAVAPASHTTGFSCAVWFSQQPGQALIVMLWPSRASATAVKPELVL